MLPILYTTKQTAMFILFLSIYLSILTKREEKHELKVNSPRLEHFSTQREYKIKYEKSL